ncbi:MAG: adenylate/guanylate cyclase domain-containing protein, partial [Pseudomonadota bacterium]
MICFNCGYRLPGSGYKECSLCGAKFPLTCEACGSPNPLMAKFCLNCGRKFAVQDTQSSVQNFQSLPESRKNVAVIFADISGFTVLSEKMDPEEVREIINACFDFITKPVYELEGTIDKYIGDCVMILFGAKHSHSDDSLRAVICAMKMIELIGLFSKEVLHNKGVSLTLSIGINYGLVVTGSVGNYFDKDYTVLGDTVNTAQRLQAIAGKGEILVSQSVYAETQDSVQYSDMREISVKNKEKPVKCYTPVGLIKAYGKSDTELIERDGETSFINSIFTDHKGAKTIVVIGESGIGKTCLVRSFISTLNDNIKAIWIDCDPIYCKRVYYLISSFLYGLLNISRETDSIDKKARLVSYVDYVLKGYNKEEIQRNYEFLGLAMGLDRSRDFQDILDSMKYDDIKREIINQLSIFTAELSKEQEIILVVDDIQYADSESIIILGEILNRLTDSKLTLIFNTTYELEQLKSFDEVKTKSLRLERLSKDGVYRQLCSLLSCNTIEDSLLGKVYQYTNGNPLY